MFEEATYSIREALDNVDFNPVTLEQVESRLAEIDKLKKKYGESVEAILEYAALIEEELEEISNKDDRMIELEEKHQAVLADLELEAETVTDLRKSAAAYLKDAIMMQLKDLYMEKTKFHVAFHPIGPNSFQKDGQDKVEFMISTNPGEPIKPLAKVASGGEISRIMLALKSIFSANGTVTSVIFDEVDTGVSGRVAQAIAEKIQRISKGSKCYAFLICLK